MPSLVIQDRSSAGGCAALSGISLEGWLRAGLCLTLIGAGVLPLVPIWPGITTAIAAAWLLTRPMARVLRSMLIALLVATSTIYLVAWIGALASAPLRFFIDSLLHPHGQPIDTFANASQLVGQAVLAAALAHQAWRRGNRQFRAFVAACMAFTLWSVVAASWNVASGMSDRPEIILAGAAIWVNWTAMALLAAMLFGQRRYDHLRFLSALALAAVLIAASLLLQWLIGDYSYVLVAPGSDEYFARVRGPYYYHAPAAQFVAFAFPIVIMLLARRPRSLLPLVIALAIAAVLLLNDTRAISLATLASLGICAGFLVFTGKMANSATAISVLVAVVVSTQIFYVKPGHVSVNDAPVAHMQAASQDTGGDSTMPELPLQETEQGSSETLLQSNSLRGSLALAGLSEALERPLTGFGPGNGRIVLPNNRSNQKRFEISSHVLAIDLAMMGGFPAAIAFAAIFIVPAIGALAFIARRPRSDGALIYAGVLAALVVYAISTFFHPQEHSSIILIVMAVVGALARQVLDEAVTDDDANAVYSARAEKSVIAAGTGALALALAGWLVMTSPSYVFPTIEFVARYGHELKASHAPVFTTNPLLNHVLGVGMALGGIEQKPAVLADDPAKLPRQEGFIIWAPADERRYPALRASLGPAEKRRYGQWMSVDLLPSWTLADNFQPNVQFIRVGAFPNIEVALGNPEGVPFGPGSGTNVHLSPDKLPKVDAIYLTPEAPTGEGGSVRVVWFAEDGEGHETIVAHTGETVTLPPPNSGVGLELAVADADVQGRLYISGLMTSMPSITHLAEGRLLVNGSESPHSDARLLMDLSDQSATRWEQDQEAVIELELPEPVVIAAYRMLPQIEGPRELPMPLEWRLEAEMPDGRLILIDEKSLGGAPAYGVGFAVAQTEPARRYRFTFPAQPADETTLIQIRELHLNPRSRTLSPVER